MYHSATTVLNQLAPIPGRFLRAIEFIPESSSQVQDGAYPNNVDGGPGGFDSEDVEWDGTMDLPPRWLIR